MNRKILFVDDDLDSRMIVADYLRNHGYNVLTVEDAEDALRVTEENDMDAMILDVTLFGMDGPQLFEELQRIAPDVPVLLYSGATEKDAKVRRMLSMGARQFISKNQPLDDLAQALQSLFHPVERS